MQIPIQLRVPVDDARETPFGGEPATAKVHNQTDPNLTEAEVDGLLGDGADHQSRQFARYAVLEAAQDGGTFASQW